MIRSPKNFTIWRAMKLDLELYFDVSKLDVWLDVFEFWFDVEGRWLDLDLNWRKIPTLIWGSRNELDFWGSKGALLDLEMTLYFDRMSIVFFSLRVRLVPVKCFPENMYFPEMLISGKGKCIQAVWLSRKSFSEKSIPVFGSSKHFTEIVLRKINSDVWFVQTFYGKCFTKIVLKKIISDVWFVDHFTENMKCVTNSSLHYLDKPVTVQS